MTNKVPQIRVVKQKDKFGSVWATLAGKCGVLAKDKKTAIETIKSLYAGEYEIIDVELYHKEKEENGKERS